MEKASDFCLVFVTTKTLENAIQIAKILTTEKLAACCSITPNVTSIFAWQGNINEQTESQLIIKTSAKNIDELESRVAELSVYDVPEIISVKLDQASASYLDWLKQSTK